MTDGWEKSSRRPERRMTDGWEKSSRRPERRMTDGWEKSSRRPERCMADGWKNSSRRLERRMTDGWKKEQPVAGETCLVIRKRNSHQLVAIRRTGREDVGKHGGQSQTA